MCRKLKAKLFRGDKIDPPSLGYGVASIYRRWRLASSMARYSSRGGLKVSITRVSSIVSTPCGTLLAR